MSENFNKAMAAMERTESAAESLAEIAQLKSALDAMTQERDVLKKDQGDWRQGVELIASALGEKNPPDLSCVRIAEVALNLLVELERATAAAEDERWEKLLHNLRVRRDELHRNYPFTIEEGVLERIIVEMEGAAPPAKWVDLLATKQAEIGRLTRENNQLKQAFDAYHSGSIQTRWNPQGFWWCVPNDIRCHGPHKTGREALLAAIAQLKERKNV